MNHTEESFVLINKELVITAFNKTARDAYKKNVGKPLEKGKPILSYSPPERREKVKQIYKEVFEGRRCEMQVEMPTRNGEISILQVAFIPVKNDNKEVVQAFINIKDISKEMLHLKQLEKNKKELDRIMSGSQDIICTIDDDNRILKISSSCLKILGYTPGEMIGKRLIDLVHPDDLEKTKRTVNSVENKKQGLTNFEARYRRKDNSWVNLEWTATWFEQEGIRYAIARNITERKRAEENMLFEKRQKEALINSTEDFMWSVNRQLQLVAANKSFLTNLKANTGRDIKPGDDILLKDFPEDFIRDWQTHYGRALKGESFRIETYTTFSNDKAPDWAETSFDPIYSNEEIIGVACSSRNITARKNAEQMVKESEARLKEAQSVAKIGSWQTDLKTLQVIWSSETFSIFEIEPADLGCKPSCVFAICTY